MIYNVEAETKDIIVIAGDTVDISLSVYKNNILFDMTGMQLDIDITDRSGNIIRSISSAGTLPAITISTSSFNILTSLFTLVGKYNYDVQLNNAGDIKTILKGSWIVQKQITGAGTSISVEPFAVSHRIVERAGLLVVDRTLTVTGFEGSENIDWEYVLTIA
jgi:hypothetical protein